MPPNIWSKPWGEHVLFMQRCFDVRNDVPSSRKWAHEHEILLLLPRNKTTKKSFIQFVECQTSEISSECLIIRRNGIFLQWLDPNGFFLNRMRSRFYYCSVSWRGFSGVSQFGFHEPVFSFHFKTCKPNHSFIQTVELNVHYVPPCSSMSS